MAASKKHGDELRERAIRMAVELRQDPAIRSGAIPRMAGQLGMHPETLRNWVRQAEFAAGTRAGTTTSDAERVAQLEQENREIVSSPMMAPSARALEAIAPNSSPSPMRGTYPDRAPPTLATRRGSRCEPALIVDPAPLGRSTGTNGQSGPRVLGRDMGPNKR